MAELVSIKRNVDVSPGQAAPAVFHCSQGDVGSKIILGLLNNGTAYAIPSGVTVTIEGSESNGSIFTPISATVSGSDITFYLTGEMTAVAGPAICQAVLKSGSNILGTANFTLEVESSPMGADAPPVFTDAGWTWMLNKLNTEFVPALGNETIIDAIDGKLDKNQGTANAGKYLKVGANGNVETADLDVTTDKTLSIADKAADAKAVGDELDVLKADLSQVVCPNLMGMKNWAKYPVDFSNHKYLTISTSDGSVFKSDSNLKVIFLNKDGAVMDSGWPLKNEQPYKTIAMPDSYLNVVKYLQWNGYAESSVPLMVNYGTVALDYVEYEEPIRDILKTKVDKTAVEKLIYDANHTVITSIDGWEIGTYRVHEPVASNVRIRNLNIYLVEPGSTIESTGNVQFKVIFYDALGRYQTETGWRSGVYTMTGSPTPYVRFFLRHDDESATSLDDLEKIRINLIVPKTPSLKIHVVSQYSIGDAMILKTSDKKTILIDIGRYQDYGRLKSALISEGITKIDYVIISHYHGDHVNTSNLTNLIADFDLSGCKFILPPEIPATYVDPDGYSDDLRTRQSEIISLLTTNNISYINEYNCDMWYMWLCGIKFDFYNMDHSSWYSQNADYNQMSIVCVANVGNNTVFFTGDMGNPLETKLFPILNRTVTIAKFGHHGLNGNPNLDFWHKIKPELLFATTPEVWHDELIANSQQIRFANYNGIKYISAHVSGGKIIINVDPNGYSTDGYNYMLDNLSSEEYFDYVL